MATPVAPPQTITGDLLTSREKFIVHQCNCCSSGPQGKGLAEYISKAFPYATPYTERARTKTYDTPGSIRVYIPPPAAELESSHQPVFIGLFAQYGPGRPSLREGGDTAANRLRWFMEGLERIARGEDGLQYVGGKPERIAMPFTIGCGMAGGHWPTYEYNITEWSKTSQIEVVFYRHPEADARGTIQRK